MNDDFKLEMEREIFRRTPEGRALNRMRNNWPFPEPKKVDKPRWRVGGRIRLNVYEGDIPMFQCHTPDDAARIVALLNKAGG